MTPPAFLFSTGNTILGGATNVSMCVISLQLLHVLNTIFASLRSASSGSPDAPALAPTSPFEQAYPAPASLTRAEIHTAPEALRAIIRILASVTIGLSIFCCFSGGFGLLPSVFVAVHGAMWLSVTHTVAKLAASVKEMKASQNANCCCGSNGKLAKLHTVAVVGIACSCILLLVGSGIGLGLGTSLWRFRQNCIQFGERAFCYSTAKEESARDLGLWMFYIAGNSFFAGALNITLCVMTIQLIKMLHFVEDWTVLTPKGGPSLRKPEDWVASRNPAVLRSM